MFIGNVDYQEIAKAAMVDIQKVKTTINILKPQKNRSPFFSGPATKRGGGGGGGGPFEKEIFWWLKKDLLFFCGFPY